MAVEDTTVSSLVGEPGRLATVLFADVSDSTKLYETLGDKIAHAAIGGWIEAMKRAPTAGRGPGGENIRGEGVAVFPMPGPPPAAAPPMQAPGRHKPIRPR